VLEGFPCDLHHLSMHGYSSSLASLELQIGSKGMGPQLELVAQLLCNALKPPTTWKEQDRAVICVIELHDVEQLDLLQQSHPTLLTPSEHFGTACAPS